MALVVKLVALFGSSLLFFVAEMGYLFLVPHLFAFFSAACSIFSWTKLAKFLQSTAVC